MNGGAMAMVGAGIVMAGVGALGMVLLATGNQFQFMYSEDGGLNDENWVWSYGETEDEPKKIVIRAHDDHVLVWECTIKGKDEKPIVALKAKDQLDKFIGEMKGEEKRRNFIGNCERKGEIILEIENNGDGNKLQMKDFEDLYGKNPDEVEADSGVIVADEVNFWSSKIRK